MASNSLPLCSQASRVWNTIMALSPVRGCPVEREMKSKTNEVMGNLRVRVLSSGPGGPRWPMGSVVPTFDPLGFGVP